MKPRIGRRRLTVATLEISAVLGAMIVAVALFAFGSYVSSVRTALERTLGEIESTMARTTAAHDSEVAGEVAATHYLSPDAVIVFFDANKHVVVYHGPSPESAPVIAVGRRGDDLALPKASGPFAQPILGLAAAFGLQPLHGRMGGVNIFVRASDRAVAATVGAFVLPLFLALLLAGVAGYAIASVLTRQMLQPLVDVTAALERFASGDLTPQPIDADVRREFGPLAVAYNGAIEQMERAFAEREHANAAMRQFIADAGHQLRTPLTVIRGFLGILRRGELRTPEDRERIIETMSSQSQLMGSLIEKLMLLEHWESQAALGGGSAEPIDVGQLVGDAASQIAEANAERSVRIDAQPGPLAAIDPSDLMHVVNNLLDNALKYTQGAIGVDVRRTKAAVVIDVSDEGPGMAPEVAAHVFDRFFRGAQRDVVGSGLGLAIAKSAIERAGGTLTLATDVKSGSRFTIALPLLGGERREARPEPVALTA